MSEESSFNRYLTLGHGEIFRQKYLQHIPEETVDCVLCGSSLKKTLFSYGDFKAVKCLECGLKYMSPRLSNEKLQKAYEQTYAPAKDFEGVLHDMSTVEERERKRRDMKVEIEATLRHTENGRVLDVGCGAGIYLESLPDTWEKHGIDRSPWAAEYTSKVLGIPVVTGQIEDAEYPEKHFDVINMTYVLEHLRDPVHVLGTLCRWLRDDGIGIISVPNFGSICARVFREFYRLVDPCQHLFMYTPGTLKSILAQTGFEPRRIGFPYFGTPYFNRKDFFRFFSNSINRILLPLSLKVGRAPKVDRLISPPFYGNIMVAVAGKNA